VSQNSNKKINNLHDADKGDRTMIFKVFYQETKERNPKREQTQSIYIEAESEVAARQLVEDNTPYNIELVYALEGNHLEYEKENTDFQLTEF
jgi:DNA-dependent RNA polymerase auxiliary subunit epsilon